MLMQFKNNQYLRIFNLLPFKDIKGANKNLSNCIILFECCLFRLYILLL
ncbi:unnamed protein product [Paramecium octaurelia]|uniref:Uncharacterized protein n=1 Tax=Paramecium octaurelia TaxID=43137 RepID=A0A8S1UZ84_PAROT|nr:unnamed protein product [Paramecium octaurelia]